MDKNIAILNENKNYSISIKGQVYRNWYDSYGVITSITELHQTLVNGFPTVTINGKTVYVHKLVMEYFDPQRDATKPFIFHIDGNKTNNNAANLCWVNASERSSWSRKPIKERIAKMKPLFG